MNASLTSLQLRLYRPCFLASILCFILFPVSLWAQVNLPEKFIGTWSGEGSQVNPSMSWTIRIDLHGGPIGSVVGKVSYPSLGCGGELILQDASTGSSVELLEIIRYQGVRGCLTRGIIRLQIIDAKLAYNYSHHSNQATGVASLELQEVEGQRDKARRIACSAPLGSLGKEAICPNLEVFYVRWWANVCAGSVGDLYEENQGALEQPATDKSIEEWAKLETRYFQNYGGCTADLGSLLSQEDRVRWMKEARDDDK